MERICLLLAVHTGIMGSRGQANILVVLVELAVIVVQPGQTVGMAFTRKVGLEELDT